MSANIDKYQILTISLSRQGCCKDAAVKPFVIKKRSLTRNRIFPNFFSVQSVYFDKVGITLFRRNTDRKKSPGSICRRITGKKQVHILCFSCKERRLRTDFSPLPQDSRKRKGTCKDVVQG